MMSTEADARVAERTRSDNDHTAILVARRPWVKRLLTRLAKITGGFVIVASLLGLLTSLLAIQPLIWPDARSAVCAEGALWNWRPTQYCTGEYRQVSEDDATLAMDLFIGRSSGSSPLNGWQMLANQQRSELSREEFAATWGVLWAERVADVESIDGEFNRFRVTYRTYGVDETNADVGNIHIQKVGPVLQYTQVFALGYSNVIQSVESIEVIDWAPRRRSETGGDFGHSMPFWRADIPGGRTYEEASRTATVAERHGKGHLSVLCAVQDSESRDWWARTGLGWLPIEDGVILRSYENRSSKLDPTELRRCADHHGDIPTA